jgi:hypothetical protein
MTTRLHGVAGDIACGSIKSWRESRRDVEHFKIYLRTKVLYGWRTATQRENLLGRGSVYYNISHTNTSSSRFTYFAQTYINICICIIFITNSTMSWDRSVGIGTMTQPGQLRNPSYIAGNDK